MNRPLHRPMTALRNGIAALALLGTVTGCAGTGRIAPQAAAPAPVAAAPAKGPALWKVADADTTIYLFGTVHVLPKDIDWYDRPIADALGKSDQLITEIYIQPGKEAEVGQIFAAKGMLPEGQTLRGLMSDDQRARYEAALAKLGLPPAALDRLEPWLAAINLSLLPLLQSGYSTDSGVEKQLELKAPGKPRGELETVEYQADLFNSLPMSAQLDFLNSVAENVDAVKPMLDQMVADWLAGDPDGLAKLLNEDLDDPVLAEKLLTTRNANWAQWIQHRLDQPGTVFVAVGAGHLAGAGSVQDALAARGIKAIRIQ